MIWAFGVLILSVTSISLSFSQTSSVASLSISAGGPLPVRPARSDPPIDAESARILARFVASELKVRQALNQHMFKRAVLLQTIGPNEEVTGEYIRNSQFVFDDRGRRVERVLFHPASTIREMRITKEDIQDLADGQLLGIDIVEATNYNLSHVGTQLVDSRQLIAVDVNPVIAPDPNHMSQRFFVGRVWIDPTNYQIAKIRGVIEPQGKQRFPLFETWREPVNGELAFPARTAADDILHFRGRDVHYRITVRYYDYKLFASKVSINEIDEPAADPNEASTKIEESPAKPAGNPINQTTIRVMDEARKVEVCTTNRNAPPPGEYHWPLGSEVKVYFVRNMFTGEQDTALFAAMKTWTSVDRTDESGVRFVYAGETDHRMSCRGCLTVNRREIVKHDKRHYAFFNPMNQEGGLLVSAWIDLDVGIKDPKALEGFMAHELGHGLGLWDCPTCKKKRSLMNSFPGLNQNNGLVAPSSCDLATIKGVYQEERQIGATNPPAEERPATIRVKNVLGLTPVNSDKTTYSVLDFKRPLAGSARSTLAVLRPHLETTRFSFLDGRDQVPARSNFFSPDPFEASSRNPQ